MADRARPQHGPERAPTSTEGARGLAREAPGRAREEGLDAPATGRLPDRLRGGLERLSGLDLGDVRVHHDSPAPARLGAHAFTRGSEIFLGPGQARHLPHEGWHVVQQRRARVRPTLQLFRAGGPGAGVDVNDDPRLEREADAMGAAALRAGDGAPTPTPAPAPRGTAAPVIQAKMQAKNFRELIAEQTALQKAVADAPDKFAGRYTTAGFEHEFAVMTSGPLRGVSHVEVARSAERMAYKKLPFVLETDAQNALELVSPPYLIETMPDHPLPDPDEVDKVDRMTWEVLNAHCATEPTIDGLVRKLADNPGLHFAYGNVKDDETGTVEIRRENMTPNTLQPLNGAQIDRTNHHVTAKEIGGIGLTPAGQQKDIKSATAQVNFATDARTYDLLHETYGPKGDDYQRYFLKIEDDFREVMHRKAFKREGADAAKARAEILEAFGASVDACKEYLRRVKFALKSAYQLARGGESGFATTTRELDSTAENGPDNAIAELTQGATAMAAELGRASASRTTVRRAAALLESVTAKVAAWNLKVGKDGWLLKNIKGGGPDEVVKRGLVALQNFPVLGEGDDDRNLKIFLNVLARALSGQISVISQRVLKAAQEARFADPARPMTEALIYDQMLSSRVKDVQQVWLKDTVMNVGLGLLRPADWARVRALIVGGVFKGGIKRNLARYELPRLGSEKEAAPFPAQEFGELVAAGLDRIVADIDAHNLDGARRSAYKARVKQAAKQKAELPSTSLLGPASRPELFDHDAAFVGARQDTYIPAGGVQMPGVWDRRLHVVESRADSVARLRQIKAMFEKEGPGKKLGVSEPWAFDYAAYFKKGLASGSVLLDNGYVLTPAQSQALARDHVENVDTPPDGDCLFASLIQVGAFAGDVRQFRTRIADAISGGRVNLAGFGLDPVATARDIRTMGSYNNLAGDSTPSIISQVLGVEILVYNEDGSVSTLDPGVPHAPTFRVIRFTHPGAHYHATRPTPQPQPQVRAESEEASRSRSESTHL
jgi:hypothetical protein